MIAASESFAKPVVELETTPLAEAVGTYGLVPYCSTSVHALGAGEGDSVGWLESVGAGVGSTDGTGVGACESVGADVGAEKTRVKFLTKISRLTMRWPYLQIQ